MAKGKPTITKPAQKPKPPPQAKPAEEKTLADCRRARHDYFILETLTAGMVLQGWQTQAPATGMGKSTSRKSSYPGPVLLLLVCLLPFCYFTLFWLAAFLARK